MSDSDDDKPLAKRAPIIKKEAAAEPEPKIEHLEKEKGLPLKAQKGSKKSTRDGGSSGGNSAAKDKMPNIPKTEQSCPEKGSAEDSAKTVKATGGKRDSVEEPGKPKGVAKAAKENGKADKAAAAVKKERKVYELPGQTRDTPPEEDPLRKFYTSLREQRPDSAIAAKWLMQVGLLPLEEAKKEAAKLKNARSSPVKAPRGGASAPAAKRKRAADENKASGRKASAKNQAKKKQPAKKKAKQDESESEVDDNDSDFDTQPLAKRKRPAPKESAEKCNLKRPSPRGKKDVAFTDGGLDGEDSSDDDMPLAQRALKVTS